MVMDLFWMVEAGGRFVLDGGAVGLYWMVMSGGEWWWMLVGGGIVYLTQYSLDSIRISVPPNVFSRNLSKEWTNR